MSISIMRCFFLAAMMVTVVFADDRCSMKFSACPETFNNQTIVVPDKVVGIAPTVLACRDTAYIESSSTARASFFFIIDNSGSMSGDGGSDPTGARFNVTQALLDTIYKKQPNAQVGLAVFQEYLYLDTSTSSRFWFSRYFKTMSRVYDTLPRQAYMPLLTLNQVYDGRRGIDILDSALATTGSGSNQALKYSPNFSTQGRTNINIGFLAAREAFANALTGKNNQYIVFLSDGEANRGAQDPGPDGIYYFRDSTRNVPTTFTVFFNSGTSTGVPGSIDTMTRNIRSNGYSASNPSSADFAITASYSSLSDVLMSNVISRINIPAVPIQMILNNVTSNTYANGQFVFPDSFMLNNTTTQYTMLIKYRLTNPSTGQTHDSTEAISFSIRRDPAATIPPGISLACTTITVPIPVTATLLDTNHDGHLDMINITWIDTNTINSIMPSAAAFIRNLNLISLDGQYDSLHAIALVPDLANKTIHIILQENKGPIYETGWQTATVTLTKIPMTADGKPFTVIKVVDGADPVIKQVYYIPGETKDSLIVIFSEPIDWTTTTINPNDLFVVLNNGDKFPITNFTPLSISKLSDRIVYELPHGKVIPGDSIYVPNNPIVPIVLGPSVGLILSIQVRANPFVVGVTEVPVSQRNASDPALGTKIWVVLNKPPLGTSGAQVIIGTVTIFDAVGNVVVKNTSMKIDGSNNLAFVWDGKNKSGMKVSYGTYLARVRVNEPSTGRKDSRQINVGVKSQKN